MVAAEVRAVVVVGSAAHAVDRGRRRRPQRSAAEKHRVRFCRGDCGHDSRVGAGRCGGWCGGCTGAMAYKRSHGAACAGVAMGCALEAPPQCRQTCKAPEDNGSLTLLWRAIVCSPRRAAGAGPGRGGMVRGENIGRTNRKAWGGAG